MSAAEAAGSPAARALPYEVHGPYKRTHDLHPSFNVYGPEGIVAVVYCGGDLGLAETYANKIADMLGGLMDEFACGCHRLPYCTVHGDDTRHIVKHRASAASPERSEGANPSSPTPGQDSNNGR